MLRLLFQFRGESLLLDRLGQLLDVRFVGVIRDKQQVEIHFRIGFTFPFVFHQLDTVKLCQSLFDLVRSVASQDLQSFVHSGDVQSDVGRFGGCGAGWRWVGHRRRFSRGCVRWRVNRLLDRWRIRRASGDQKGQRGGHELSSHVCLFTVVALLRNADSLRRCD